MPASSRGRRKPRSKTAGVNAVRTAAAARCAAAPSSPGTPGALASGVLFSRLGGRRLARVAPISLPRTRRCSRRPPQWCEPWSKTTAASSPSSSAASARARVAEDILQDAFVRGLARAGKLRDEDSVVAWFYRTLRNALVDHWRRTGAERRAPWTVRAGSRARAAAVDAELMDAVCGARAALLDTLKPEYAEALRRVDLDDVSVKAFAASSGTSRRTTPPSGCSARARRCGGRSCARAARAPSTAASTAPAGARPVPGPDPVWGLCDPCPQRPIGRVVR